VVCLKEKHGEDTAHREGEKAMAAAGSSLIPANRRGQQMGLAVEGLTRAQNWRGGEGAHAWWFRCRSREGKREGKRGPAWARHADKKREGVWQRDMAVSSVGWGHRQLRVRDGGGNSRAARGQGREAADVQAHGHNTGWWRNLIQNQSSNGFKLYSNSFKL
jgi:hypothetical protein